MHKPLTAMFEPGVVIAHVEANVHLHRTLTKIREAGGSPSVALNPHTPAEMIENVLDLVDHVLVMTVNPGFGGQAYIPTMTDKIRKIRKWGDDRGLDFDIEVDGGVKADWTIAACAEAGANCFIAGSGMFKYDDLSVGCSELRKIAEAAQKGKRLLVKLKEALSDHPHVGDVRGLGMMCGVELVKDKATKQMFDATDGIGAKVNAETVKRGMFSRVRGDVYCVAPPIVTGENTIDEIADILGASVRAVLG